MFEALRGSPGGSNSAKKVVSARVALTMFSECQLIDVDARVSLRAGCAAVGKAHCYSMALNRRLCQF